MVEVIGLYSTVTGGTQDGAATMDVPRDGFLIGIDWDASVILDAASEVFDSELSFVGSNQLATAEVRGRLSSISARCEVLSAVGLEVVSIQKWIGNFDIVVAGGERLFVHIESTAGVGGIVRVNLFFDLGVAPRRSARRR